MSASRSRPTFFVDRSLGRIKIVHALRLNGESVVAHDSAFPQRTTDTAWLAEAGRQGWVVLTKDKRIRTHPIELAALLEAGIAAFVLTSGNITGEQMAEAYLAAMPAMLRILAATPRPFIARVTTAGAVELIATKKK